MPRVRTCRSTLAIATIALVLAACGSDDESTSSSDTTRATVTTTTLPEDTGERGPVTIEHRFGTTTLDEVPERIVVADHQWLDTLVAMGIPTVGHPEDPYVGNESGQLAWQRGKVSAESEGIAYSSSWPLEQVAALQPDLILATYTITSQDQYDALNKIAPTIGPMSDRTVDRWDTFVETAGKIFHREDAAADLIAEVQGEIDAVAEDLPGLDGKTYTLLNYVPGDSLVIVADPDDGASLLMADLGLELTDQVQGRDDPGQGRWSVSLERTDLLESDVLIAFSQTGDPTELIGWDDLTAVRTDAVAVLGYEEVTGLNTPSVLSLPFALDAIRPALEAAAAA